MGAELGHFFLGQWRTQFNLLCLFNYVNISPLSALSTARNTFACSDQRCLMSSSSCLETIRCDAHPASAQPCAGRPVGEQEAISAREIHAYLQARGIGFASGSELDGYPSPANVLALESDLSLTGEQRMLTRSLVDSTDAAAIRIGQLLIEQERRIDQLFTSNTLTAEAIEFPLMQIGSLTAKIRTFYADAHLVQRRILSREQIDRYVQLRRCERLWDVAGVGSLEEDSAD